MYSPLVWAYIGDAVYELRVRERLIEQSYAKPHTLHLRSIKLVNAKKQAKILEGLEETLTEEEKTILKISMYLKAQALQTMQNQRHLKQFLDIII